MIEQAVILVGGKGSRLGAETTSFPKPFLPINGLPFIERLLLRLAQHGIKRVLLLAGHAANQINCDVLEKRSGLAIDLAIEPAPMGTAGALKAFADKLDEHFFLLNGDSIFDSNWSTLVPLLDDQTAMAIALRQVPDISRYGSVKIDGNQVTHFGEKTPSGGAGFINAGIYALRKAAVLPLISGMASLEVDIIPQLTASLLVKGAVQDGYFIDIGLPETLEVARNSLDERLRKPALIFDRDNTLVKDKGYTHKPEELRWCEGAREAILEANNAGFQVFVATNQAGIARGYYGEQDMHRFHDAMQAELQIAGAHIDAFAFCPHHPEGTVEGLACECTCRKPAPGMLEQLCSTHATRLQGTAMFGDNAKDVAAAAAFGIPGYLVTQGELLGVVRNFIKETAGS